MNDFVLLLIAGEGEGGGGKYKQRYTEKTNIEDNCIMTHAGAL